MQKTAPTATGYTTTQIVLHWVIALLVLVQWINHEDMQHWWRQVKRGLASGLPEPGPAFIHIVAGAAVLILILARLAMRWRAGAPQTPADLPPLIRRGSLLAHYLLYLLLFLLPLSGLVAVFLSVEPAADAHSLMTNLLLALIALHVLGALYHLVLRRDGVFSRIFVPRRSAG